MIGTENGKLPLLAHDYRAILADHNGNSRAAAASIGMAKSTFNEKLRFLKVFDDLGSTQVSKDIADISKAIGSIEALHQQQHEAQMAMMSRLYAQQRELVVTSKALAPTASEATRAAPDWRNDSILLIPDLQAPYHHQDTLEYLAALQNAYGFERAVCLGDEIDQYSSSPYPKDPSMMKAEEEASATRAFFAQLHTLYPNLDLLTGNHGQRVLEQARKIGIPASAIQTERGYLFGTKSEDGETRFPDGIGSGWRWHSGLDIVLSTGEPLLLLHGDGPDEEDVGALVRKYKKSVAKAHLHSKFSLKIAVNKIGLTRFGIEAGCLVDKNSKAFSYRKAEPVIGCAGVLDGEPVLFRMPQRPDGRWTGRLPYEVKKRLH
jgi:hypothetical protein